MTTGHRVSTLIVTMTMDIRTTTQGSPSAQLHLVITTNPYKANFPVEGAAVDTRHRYTSIAVLFPV